VYTYGIMFVGQEVTVLCHYVSEVPVNALRVRSSRAARSSRRRSMASHHLTYGDLKTFVRQRFASGDAGLSASSLPNLLSALEGFMAERGFSERDAIGPALRSMYHRHRNEHIEQLRRDGRSGPYISNRRSLLGHWRKAVVEADRQSATHSGGETPFQAALRQTLSLAGASLKGTAREVGIPLATLRRWVAGAAPNAASARWVPVLERRFALTPGTLSDLCAPRSGTSVSTASTDHAIAYRKRLREQHGRPYALSPPADSPLRAEWAHFVAYKTTTASVNRRGMLSRSKTGRWSTTHLPVEPRRESNWFAFAGAQYVASASITWGLVSQYLGWLALPTSEGGRGLSFESAATLANFAQAGYLEEYIAWRQARSDGIFHGGVVRFLKLASSLCHPRTGYLTQCYERFSHALPGVTHETWNERCLDVHAFAAAMTAERTDTGSSRDSRQPIAHILALPNPLDAVADAVARLNADRPRTGGVTEAIWARDRLLLMLLASNPLRAKNVRMLTYRPDGTGHLRQVDGRWRIHIPPGEFKNAKGAARERAYDMPVRPELAGFIESYLRDCRPLLATSGNPYVFSSERRKDGPMHSLRRRFEIISRRYFTGCAGVGPHSMRHIVCTSILKQRPNDWTAAAWALHDKVETVRKAYAHLRSDDAYTWFDPAMAGPFGRM